MDLTGLPGADLVAQGLRDLRDSRETAPALLVSIAAARLERRGIHVEAPIADPEHRLYELLAHEHADSAHSRYNALIRRLTSFESTLECVS